MRFGGVCGLLLKDHALCNYYGIQIYLYKNSKRFIISCFCKIRMVLREKMIPEIYTNRERTDFSLAVSDL